MARDRFDDDRYRDDDRYDDRPPRRRDDDRYDDRDRYEDDRDRDDDRDRPRGPAEPSNGPAMTSLILGILSIVGGLTAIPGLICGFAGLSKAKKLGGAGKGMAVTGTVLSGVGTIILGLTVWAAIWFFGRMEDGRSRQIAQNNLKQVGLAMHNYESSFGYFPSAVARPQFGGMNQPVRESELASKLSWRVEVLPYIEQDNVYRQMRLDEAWDSFANKPMAGVAINTYTDPDTRGDPNTRYRVFYGPKTPFDPASGSRLGVASISDGTSNTVMAVESGEKVTWTRFGEIKFDESNPPNPATFGRPKTTTFQAVMFDGSVRNVRKTVSPQTFKYSVMHQDGMPVWLDD